MRIIEILIISILIAFAVQSCSNKTSMPYEMGREYQKVKSSFLQGGFTQIQERLSIEEEPIIILKPKGENQ